MSVPQLTIDNYAAVLDSVLDSLDETTVYDLAYNTALQQVTQAVNAQENEIRVQVEDTCLLYTSKIRIASKLAFSNFTPPCLSIRY